MRAILRTKFGGPEVLVIREMPEPEPKDGYAVIQVKAFGLNHAELHMRKGEWAEIADVSGIECVGVVKSCPGGEFAAGTKVAALMGGLGRTINGSYAEYTRAPVTNVAAIESGLSWADLAALPESYATAWTCREKAGSNEAVGRHPAKHRRRLRCSNYRTNRCGANGPRCRFAW